MPLIGKCLATIGVVWFALEYANRFCRKANVDHPADRERRCMEKFIATSTSGFAATVLILAIWVWS